MFSSEFTCERCGYRSEHLLMTCPECNQGASDKSPEKPPIPASHITPTGKYFEPMSDAKSKAIDIKVVQVFKIILGVFAPIIFFLLVPFYIIPASKGPDAYGYYELPQGRHSRAPGKISGSAMHTGAIVIIVFSGALVAGFLILRKKEEAMRDQYAAAGHVDPDNQLESPDINKIFGG